MLAMIIIGRSTIHPSWDRSVWRMVYLSSLRLVAYARNLLLHQVNSNICTLRLGLGVEGA